MHGTRAAWLVSLPVALAGCVAAHFAAYALAHPADEGEVAHAYLERLPIVAGGALAVVLGATVWHAFRGRTGTRPSAWLFAVLPPLAFALQEHLERLAAPAVLAGDPAFLLGLALQVPFGLFAWLLARAILRAADALAALLAAPPRPRSTAGPLAAADRSLEPLLRPFAPGTPHRGPPAAAASRS